MNARTAALAAAVCGALACVGLIVWAVIPSSDKDDSSKSSESFSVSESVSSAAVQEESSVPAEEASEPETSEEESVPEPVISEADSVPKPVKRQFTVDVLLAPLGFRVEDDYVLEIARAADVKSSPTSHLDSRDNIFYEAAVINGVTELELEEGDYELCIYPDGHPDNFKRYSWSINKDTTNKDLQLIVTEKVEEGQMMIVLHWGEKPKDIDGYLVGEGETVYYWNREGKHSRLDTDSRKGNGIEAITVTHTKGSFTYTVDDYSNEVELGKSGAVVEVFTSENRNPTIFRVPAGIKEVWEVFRLEDGKLTGLGTEGAMICPEKIDGSWYETHR